MNYCLYLEYYSNMHNRHTQLSGHKTAASANKAKKQWEKLSATEVFNKAQSMGNHIEKPEQACIIRFVIN